MRRSSSWLAALAAAAFVLLPSVALAANPGTAQTTTGQDLNIRIDDPAVGDALAPGTVTVGGVASIGDLPIGGVHVLYVADQSGSIGQTNFERLRQGLESLNASLSGTIADANAIFFSSNDSLSTKKLLPTFVGVDEDEAPANGRPDVIDTVYAEPYRGGFTHYDAALTIVNAEFATQPEGDTNVAYFFSDGLPGCSSTFCGGTPPYTSGPGSPIRSAADAGTTINTFSIGSNGPGCGPTSPLTEMADLTGGACRVVTDFSTLSADLEGITPAGITGVEVSINGGTPVAATLDSLGNWSADVPGAVAGQNTVTATVTADDGTTATADITTGPIANATPSSVDFGSVPIGTTATETVTVSNDGNAPLTVSTVSIEGDDDITVTGETCTGGPVNPGTTCEIDLAYAPESTGTSSATLTVVDNGGGPGTIEATGTGEATIDLGLGGDDDDDETDNCLLTGTPLIIPLPGAPITICL